VQLSQLENDYHVMEVALTEVDLSLNAHANGLKELAHKTKDAEALYNLSRRNQSLYDNLESLKHQMAWSQVIAQEQVHLKRDFSDCRN